MTILINIDWQEFVEKYKSHQIEVWVDINKGHALMKSSLAPMVWRVLVSLTHLLALLSLPLVITLFFFFKWWIPVIIFIDCVVVVEFVRRASQRAVIRNSLKHPVFYQHAILSGTMEVNSIKD